jgi:hypothetical protein
MNDINKKLVYLVEKLGDGGDGDVKLSPLEDERWWPEDGHVVVDCCQRNENGKTVYVPRINAISLRNSSSGKGYKDITCQVCNKVYRLYAELVKQFDISFPRSP